MPQAQEQLFGELRLNWGWLLALGVLSVILGIVGLGMTFLLTLASVLYFGVLVLIAGGVQLVQAFKFSGWKSVLSHVVMGLLYMAAGGMVIGWPLLAPVVLTWILAGILIAVGVLRLVIAVEHRATPGWVSTLFGGVLTVLIGLIILARWPLSSLWVIGLLIAVELIVKGWSEIFIALAARGAGAAQSTRGRTWP